MANKAGAEKREYAEMLYMKAVSQREIAEKTGVSVNTIGRWVNEGHWEEKRGAQALSRTEIVNNLLRSINAQIEELAKPENLTKAGNIADRLAKLASVVSRLDKEVSVVDFIDCFIAFGKWLEYQSANDKNVTAEFRKQVNVYQDRYIGELLAGKA